MQSHAAPLLEARVSLRARVRALPASPTPADPVIPLPLLTVTTRNAALLTRRRAVPSSDQPAFTDKRVRPLEAEER